jgi:hypothetical protein
MKQNIVRRMLISLSFAVVFAALLPTAHGQSCSLARAAGNYALTNTGTVVGIGPRSAVGIWTMDVAGNINGKGTSSLNGSIFAETFSGTYAVNPDCTGITKVDIFDQSGKLLLSVTADIAWDDNMREARFIFTSAVSPVFGALQTVINGDARKMVLATGQ